MTKIIRYEGYYHDGECWLAILGGAEWPRHALERALSLDQSPEQRAEIERALKDMPGDDVAPKPGQRKKITPAEGQLDE